MRLQALGLAALALCLPVVARADSTQSHILQPLFKQGWVWDISYNVSSKTTPCVFDVTAQVINDHCIEDPELVCDFWKRKTNGSWQIVGDQQSGETCTMPSPTEVGTYRFSVANFTNTCVLKATVHTHM